MLYIDANIIVGSENDKLEVKGMIDVGDMVYTWRINEIAIAAAYALLTEFGGNNVKLTVDTILKGYTKVLSLNKTEVNHFYLLMFEHVYILKYVNYIVVCVPDTGCVSSCL